jgi:uncharacterized membrane protein/mono/diheme cytochrome c family protein
MPFDSRSLFVGRRAAMAVTLIGATVIAGGPARGGEKQGGASASAVRELYREHCAKCHGLDGKGTVGRKLFPEIPDFTRGEWPGERTDAQLEKSILEGKGADMPAYNAKMSAAKAKLLVTYLGTMRASTKKTKPPSDGSEESSHPVRQPLEYTPAFSVQWVNEPGPDVDFGPCGENGAEEEPGAEETFLVKLMAWLGRFHPAAVHFPIGLVVAAAAAEGLLLVTGRPLFDAASRFCVWFAAPGALPAAMFGWFAAGLHTSDANAIMAAHRWLGTSIVILTGVVLLLSEVSRRSDRRARVGFRLVLCLDVLLILATAFLGGGLSHGLSHYAWPS